MRGFYFLQSKYTSTQIMPGNVRDVFCLCAMKPNVWSQMYIFGKAKESQRELMPACKIFCLIFTFPSSPLLDGPMTGHWIFQNFVLREGQRQTISQIFSVPNPGCKKEKNSNLWNHVSYFAGDCGCYATVSDAVNREIRLRVRRV